MKKLIPVLVGLGLVIAAVLYFIHRPTADNASGPEMADIAAFEAPPAGDEAFYTVKISAKQLNRGMDSTLIDMDATLSQIKQSDTEYVTQWSSIAALNLMNSKADQAATTVLLGKPSVTTIEGKTITHYLAKDFPPGLTTFQLSFLQKIFVGLKADGSAPILKTEKDEVGAAQVQYAFEKAGANTKVTKTWLGYTQDSIKVDAVDNQLIYGLAPDGRLLSVVGTLTLHYRKPSPSHFTTTISVILKNHQAKSSLHKTVVNKDNLQKTDMTRATAVTRQIQNQTGMTYDDALKQLDTMTEKTDSKIVYTIFSTLKADVIEHPEHAGVLVSKILETKTRDEGSRRRLSAMFGALAQSESPAIADSLASLATECPDNFCKVQAIVALNDHPAPSESNAAKMIDLAAHAVDTEIASTAVLAAGSIGKKVDVPELSKALIDEYNDPSKASLKTAVVAAMGNHGSAEYLPTLKANLTAPDTNLRGSSVYSLRYIPGDDVNTTLLNVVQKETDKGVTSEALKALQFKNLTDTQYVDVAQKAATFADADLQQSAARMLVEAYNDNPKVARKALETLRDSTKVPNVKTYIDSELNAKPADAGHQ
ncbi:MAG: HEAT repeat domain-containing protein [Chitinophagaceae bacterium]|nr:HEAT repeat domain-containing protein [Oligoflexus sp.]